MELVDILVCPQCHGPLTAVASPHGYGCARCQVLYPIEDDIPNFIAEDAVPWNPDTD